MANYKFTATDGDLFSDQQENITLSVETGALGDVLDSFTRFLRGVGFSVKGELIVLEEGDVLFSHEEANDIDQSLRALEDYREAFKTTHTEQSTPKSRDNLASVNQTLQRRVLSLDLVEEKLTKYSGNKIDPGLIWEILTELDEELSNEE